MGAGVGEDRSQERRRAFTWLRRQKRRGSRQVKKYLPHRITQEKHQLSRVMVTPGWAPLAGARVWGEDRPLRALELEWEEEEGESPAPGGGGCPGAPAPREQPECPAPY